ncbi:MAG: hypothetical protein GXY80_12900 [Syntrophorhabdus aromaticivorans]|uniref:Uncharacterized protein n=1 Tax=Syntrophorhabdus aromaticivorans TaxID=328301 RepID=A0A971M5N8_9BACT|nr:hypothetical protein [Syntrophorhabdus aromaticivorans]
MNIHNASATLWREVGLNMRALMKKGIGFCVIFVILTLLCVQMAFARDYLFLTGFVKSYDSNTGIVTINVTSEGCKGQREFKMPGDAKEGLDASFIGQQLQFYIDSSACEQGKVYNILGGR